MLLLYSIGLLLIVTAARIRICSSSNPGTVRILQLGEPSLREPCKEVNLEEIVNIGSSTHLYKIRKDLHEALNDFQKSHGFGRAIAAPQIGHNIRMIAMKLSPQEPAITLYNPKIVDKSAECVDIWDDCFSFPNLMVRVSRHNRIRVCFINDWGEEKTWDCSDIAISELVQHEIDHLDGILAIDRALPDLPECPSIIDRKEWLENRIHYGKFVS